LVDNNPSFLLGYGSQSAAYHAAWGVNANNPASFAWTQLTSFEAGGFFSIAHAKTSIQSQSFADGTLSNFSIGFPVWKKKLGIATGILPVSRVSYSVFKVNDTLENTVPSVEVFKGNGGLFQYFLGTGFKLKNFSAGFSVNYLFGNLSYNTIVAFPDTLNANSTWRSETRYLDDLTFTGGLQYQLQLKDQDMILFGVDGNLKSNVNATRNLLYQRVTFQSSGIVSVIFPDFPNPKDTILNVINEHGSITMPAQLHAGIIFQRLYHFKAGLQFNYGWWDQYESFGTPDQTGNNWSLTGGAEWVPNYQAFRSYTSLISYRLGFVYGTNYRTWNGSNIKQYGASAGFGFPIHRSLNSCDISFQWLRTGDLSTVPLVTNYYRITVGFSLNDIWFLKPKFE
jgi:hypothetical protein